MIKKWSIRYRNSDDTSCVAPVGSRRLGRAGGAISELPVNASHGDEPSTTTWGNRWHQHCQDDPD
ncbi:hypothetical protein [Synechococcus sp. MIT S1220]|uniref:hypothetical protein n=1 Tax=Synechococcus sp. MIT S1220 TaxID=3082549 RepID=UPI0039AFE9D9